MSISSQIKLKSRGVWSTLGAAVNKFMQIDGEEWAGAFAHYAFFSLFPSIIFFVTIASIFVDRDRAGTQIIAYIEAYIPIGQDEHKFIFDTVGSVVKVRGQASVVAFIMLAWASMRFFSTLIRATNRAWGIDAHNWWRLPLKSLVFLAIIAVIVLCSIATPVLVNMAKEWLIPSREFRSWVHTLWRFLIPMLVVFLGLSLFYRLAPRRRTRFSEVWVAALVATVLLQVSETLFVLYLTYFVSLNAVYGTFGGIMAMLLWIYVFGCIFIFGACLCAAQSEARVSPVEVITA